LKLTSSGSLLAKSFFSSENASSYDTLVRLATFGRDSIWKQKLARPLKNHRCILDLAAGTGILSSYITPEQGRVVIGSDLVFDYLLLAKKRHSYLLLTNSVAEFLPFRDKIFDAVLSSYLAKYVDIQQVVQEHWRILKDGGLVAFHDFTLPRRIVVNQLWYLYFLLLRLGSIFVKSWKNVLCELDKVIVKSDWVEDLMKELKETGFKSINCKYYTCGTAAVILGIKP
jgi:demethylmenaquinone methyltransferase / 2-methoxy-6-polyprenyl-1,4-benzoquinol methylase